MMERRSQLQKRSKQRHFPHHRIFVIALLLFSIVLALTTLSIFVSNLDGAEKGKPLLDFVVTDVYEGSVGIPKNASVSVACRSKRSNLQAYCEDTVKKGCQARKGRLENVLLNEVDLPTCKTLWVSGMHVPDSSCRKINKGNITDAGDGYVQQYAAALQSWKQNAATALQPVLMLLQRPDSNVTGNGHRERSSPFERWVKSQGAWVVHVERLSFQNVIEKRLPDYVSDGRAALFLILDIPEILKQNKLLEMPGICDRHVFYTDSDVLFLNTVLPAHLESLKRALGDKLLMYGQDFLIDRPKPSNTGVMLMDVPGFSKEWPSILEFGKNRKVFPDHDQTWLNYYYANPRKWKAQNVLLPVEWNWKVYWGLTIADEDLNDVLSNVRIVHFHGPKPGLGVEEIAACSIEGDHIPDSYQSFIRHGICCDSGKTAATVLALYRQWKHSRREICT